MPMEYRMNGNLLWGKTFMTEAVCPCEASHRGFRFMELNAQGLDREKHSPAGGSLSGRGKPCWGESKLCNPMHPFMQRSGEKAIPGRRSKYHRPLVLPN